MSKKRLLKIALTLAAGYYLLVLLLVQGID